MRSSSPATTRIAAPGPLSVSSRVEGLWFAALAARALGDEEAAQGHLRTAWDVLVAIAAPMTPDERRTFLQETSPHREIAQEVGAKA